MSQTCVTALNLRPVSAVQDDWFQVTLLMSALLVLVLAIATFAGSSALQTIPASSPLIQQQGRTFVNKDGSVTFEWLGGGFRLAHTGSALWATPVATTHPYKISFAQANEGFVPPQGVAWVTPKYANTSIMVASGAGLVRVSLNVAVQYWAGGTAGILSFTTDGEFTAPPPQKRTLHFLGDSITAATNIHGLGIVSCGDGGYESDYLASWAGLICTALDADCTTVAVGGRGLVRNCCGMGAPFMPEYYQLDRYTDSHSWTNFSATTPPDGVLVFLGTNDYSSPVPGLDTLFTAGYLEFIHNVSRVWYGTPEKPADITFFATLGPMSPTLPANATIAAVEQALALGYKIKLINATAACGAELKGCKDGCASHPGVVGHRNMADVAIPIVRAALGW